MRSLVAEDDLTNRVLLQQYLSQFGPCDVVEDGKQAVDAISRARGLRITYDLICMDLLMPSMSGHEAVREIRRQEQVEGVVQTSKVIVTTALSDMENITNALQGKCNAYLVKPIDTAKLQQELHKLGLVD